MTVHTTALVIFGVIVLFTLGVTFWAGRRTHTSDDFWAAGHSIGPTQNGFAIAGDFLSAAAFLGTTGLIFLFGFDGMIYLFLPLAAFVPVLFFYAERMRNLGKFTLTEVIMSRFPSPAIRTVLALSTLAISGVYLLAQLLAAGALFQLLAGVRFPAAVAVTSAIMLVYVTVGGMLATTWVQYLKAVLLLGVLALLVVLCVIHFHGHIGGMFHRAMLRSGPFDPLVPRNFFHNGWNALSTCLALLFGVIGLPHVIMRFFTVPDASSARRSVSRALTFLAVASVLVVFVGLAARVTLRDQWGAIAQSGTTNVVVPKLGEVIGGGPGTTGGGIVLGLVSAVAFATILAVVSGLLINASSVVVRDLSPRRTARELPVTEDQSADDRREVRRARVAAAVIAVVMAALTVWAGPGLNVSVLVTMALGIAASANFPALTLTLYWSRFTAGGAIVGSLAGLISAVTLVILGPTLWPGGGSSPVSLIDPTVVSMPIGFLGCLLGTWLTRHTADTAEFARIRRRSFLGGQETATAIGGVARTAAAPPATTLPGPNG